MNDVRLAINTAKSALDGTEFPVLPAFLRVVEDARHVKVRSTYSLLHVLLY